MPTFDELDRLPSKELHDRAARLAEHRLDVTFFWDLLKDIPAAEAAAGDEHEAGADIAFQARFATSSTRTKGSSPTRCARCSSTTC